MKKFFSLIILLCAVVVPLWAGTSGPGRMQPGEESSFAIPRMNAVPVLDGAIDPLEWREAVAISGTVDMSTDLLDPRPATFYLAWDKDHLYMACRVYLPPGYKPRLGGGRAIDCADCFDDGLELLFKPMGKNVSSSNRATMFKLNISALGFGGTYTRLVVGQIMKNWEPKQRSAVRVTAPGTAPNGGAWWEMETAFANNDFELKGENRAGDQWKMMLGINHMPSVGWMQERIPCIGGYFTAEGKSLATLVENTPAVQMTMNSLSNLASDGTASVVVTAFNPAKTATQVNINLSVAEIARNETLDLPGGGEKTFMLNEKLPEQVSDGKISLRVSQGTALLLSYNALFHVGAYSERLKSVALPDPNKFTFAAKFNPVRGLLQLTADSYYLPDPMAAKSLKYQITNKATGQLLTSGEITKLLNGVFDDVLTFNNIATGTYEVTCSLLLKDGSSYGPQTASFEKKDEAAAFPRWWGKDPGNAERVLSPFTAITRQGAKLSCWGREYELNSLGLPNAVRSQQGKVLSAPARVVVVVGGKETVIKLGKPVITDVKDWRVRFEGKAEGAGLTFLAEGWMEQDGLVNVNLTYQPKAGKKVLVDALRIEYPVANEVADCLGSVGPGANVAAISTIILSKEKQGQLWSTFDTGRKGSGMMVGSFYPHVWLGSERRGFMWWADNDKGWFPDDDVPAHVVTREHGAVVLANNIIGKPVTLTDSHTISFTWMASPFKPLPQGWRNFAATEDGTFFQPFRGVRTNPKTGQKYWDFNAGNINWINPESEDPTEWSKLWAEQKLEADKIVHDRRPFDLYSSRFSVSYQHMSFQLIGYGPKSMEKDVYAYFGDEWMPGGDDTWNPSYIDYAMWLLDRAYREGGVVSSYWDLSFPIYNNSPLSGLAYRLPDGRMQPGYNSLNCRRFFQRLWAVQDKNGLNPGCVGSHSTQAYIYPSLPWLDAVLDGERDWDLDVSDMDWVDYYPIARMRTMSCPHNWGVGICWMSNFTSSNPKKIIAAKTTQAEYIWMHDSWINPYMDPAYEVNHMPQPILDWGLNGSDVVYVPYWRNGGVSSGDPDVLVSLWKMKGRIVLGVFNYDRRAVKNVKLKLDLAALGLKGKDVVVARDLYQRAGSTACKFDAASGILTIASLVPHTGQFVGLRKTDPVVVSRAAGQLKTLLSSAGIAEAVELPDAAVNQGLITETTVYQSAAPATLAQTEAGIQVAMWQLPDRVLFAIINTTPAAKDATLKLNLEQLGLTPRLKWQEFLGVRDLNKGANDVAAALDFYGQTLTVKAMQPRQVRLVAVRRY